MLILPERGVCRTKVLLPVAEQEWRAPSARRRTFGIADQTRFMLVARLADGAVRWRGWFDDRNDADALLWSLVTGRLKWERQLWSLPVEVWTPEKGYTRDGWWPFDADVTYELLTQVFLTTTGANTWSKTSDYNNANNTISTIGGGGGGRDCTSHLSTTGAGGGAFSQITNLSLAGSSTINYTCGAAGTSGVPGTNGGDSWFNGTTISGASCSAQGGVVSAAYNATPGAGGLSSAGVGTTKNSGGNGGQNSNSGFGAGAGGGAGGPGGQGQQGGNAGATGSTTGGPGGGGAGGASSSGGATPTSSSGTNGGNGSDGTGGGTGATGTGAPAGGNGTANAGQTAGGGGGGLGDSGTNTPQSTGGNGGAGKQFDSTHGSGGGAGAAGSGAITNAPLGGVGGLYGGGASGAVDVTAGSPRDALGTNGAQGLVVVEYTAGLRLQNPLVGFGGLRNDPLWMRARGDA